jgi:hypothetical protein
MQELPGVFMLELQQKLEKRKALPAAYPNLQIVIEWQSSIITMNSENHLDLLNFLGLLTGDELLVFFSGTVI